MTGRTALLIFAFVIAALTFAASGVPAGGKDFCTMESVKIPAGESAFIPGKCMKATCSKDLSITGTTCATASIGRGCTKSSYDYSKPYPDCCPKVTCS